MCTMFLLSHRNVDCRTLLEFLPHFCFSKKNLYFCIKFNMVREDAFWMFMLYRNAQKQPENPCQTFFFILKFYILIWIQQSPFSMNMNVFHKFQAKQRHGENFQISMHYFCIFYICRNHALWRGLVRWTDLTLDLEISMLTSYQP